MPRKFLKKYMPDHKTIREQKALRIFGNLLHDPNIWHLNRRSVAKAFAVGLFFMMVPVPFQMALAAGFAILVHSNLPISVGLVWISNPITMPPMFYFAYKVGTWILGSPERTFHFELSWSWLGNELLTIWQPFLLGCFVCGVVCSVVGYYGIGWLWRWSVVKRMEEKRQRMGTAKK